MTHPRRHAAAFLIAGFVLAVGTPVYVSRAAPHLAGYLMHPTLFLLQATPYVVCAVIWLPWRTRSAAISALALAGLLFLASLMVYLPILLAPRKQGGDMIGLAYVLIAGAMTGGVLVGSAVAGMVLWLRARVVRVRA